MRFFKRIAGLLGFSKDDGGHEVRDQQQQQQQQDLDHHYQQQVRSCSNFKETGLPRKGFGVPVQLVVDRPQLGPIIVPCNSGDGGIQGLRWYAKRLRIDEDGDVADEFLYEISPDASSSCKAHNRSLPRFEMKYSTRPAKIKNQVMSHAGKIQQCVEHNGRLQWV